MDSVNIKFILSNDWFLTRDALVFGVFDGDTGPCGINFKKETIEDNFSKVEHVFKSIKSHLDQGDFKGKFGEIFLTYLFDNKSIARRVIIIGLGKKADFTEEKLRQAGAKVAQYVRDLGVKNFTTTLFGSPQMDATVRFRALIEGIGLGLYKFDHFKSSGGEEKKIAEVEFLFPENIIVNEDGWDSELKRSLNILSAVYLARNLANNPASVVTPKFLAQTARTIAKSSAAFTCEVFGREDLEKNKMNAILEVGKGSDSEPHFIILNYKPAGAQNQKPIALVGKGVCFDSGGISIKPSDNMDEMKMDMAGAAAVLAALKAASDLKLPMHIVGVIPAVENIPGPKSYKPGDIVRTYSGKTIEVLNTDAEGRIILADALSYAVKNFDPAVVIDLATLTGACVVALGYHYGAVLGSDEKLMADLIESGKKTNEKIWPLPLDDDFKKQIESEIADVRNIGGRAGGTITAAMFLKEFVGNANWAHIDIAGPAILAERRPYAGKGGSGFGVRLLLEFLEKQSNI